MVPVGVVGTADVVEGDGPWFSPSARVELRIGAPIAPDAAPDDDGLAALAQERIVALTS